MSQFKVNVVRTPCGGQIHHRFSSNKQLAAALAAATTQKEELSSLFCLLGATLNFYNGQETSFESELSMCQGREF